MTCGREGELRGGAENMESMKCPAGFWEKGAPLGGGGGGSITTSAHIAYCWQLLAIDPQTLCPSHAWPVHGPGQICNSSPGACSLCPRGAPCGHQFTPACVLCGCRARAPAGNNLA